MIDLNISLGRRFLGFVVWWIGRAWEWRHPVGEASGRRSGRRLEEEVWLVRVGLPAIHSHV